jgi:hypothetical protein
VQLVPLADGTGPVAQFMVLPKDHETWLWYAEHELFGANE